MLLLVDIGNTRIKMTAFDGERLGAMKAVAHNGDPRSCLKRMIESAETPRSYLSCWISSVALLNDDEFIEELSQDALRIPAYVVKTKHFQYGVENAYSIPEELGVDRWLCLIAVKRRTDKAVLVVDCGTAVTIDAMNAEGKHLGGLILPGLSTMWQGLARNTKAIAAIECTSVGEFFANNTQQGVLSGTLNSIICLIEKSIQELCLIHSSDIECFITGGDAEVILPHLNTRFVHVPDLVLEGLSVIAK